ncbi:CGNR zinc finger domain-containing protein [Kitasatospora kifunensis]|uniref:Putative RNA-binding Zn ribbon-like protein n=1 Tax=Kitasatospora kifunensis TaxID=58351 RepID=A0A7W7RBK5_KITKI|nr:ABATE domain-containing protein [Kitasatospora kifunensis]MBB4928361.1 putative RNA-binding Zn ribbon-like protein [Kitasatospora kifunensis]
MPATDRLAFRLDCGATWLNLLATVGTAHGPAPVERIPTAERFAEWLALNELTPQRPVDEADLDSARRLREALRAVGLATVEEREPPAAAVRELDLFLRTHDDPVRVTGEGRLRRAAPPTSAAALSRIVRQAVGQLTGPERRTLKCCPEQDCRGLFSDPSDRRRWCPSPACASRGRVRALRARRAGQAD